MRINDRINNYITAAANTLVVKNENEKDEAIAQFEYTVYVQDSKGKVKRPILFAYNGDPVIQNTCVYIWVYSSHYELWSMT